MTSLVDLLPERKIRRLCSVAAFGCLLVIPAQAAELTLGTSAPPGNPLTLSPGSEGSLLVQVVNDRNPDLPVDFISGWQANLMLIPESESVGSVEFSSAVRPPNYVFRRMFTLGLSATISTTTTPDDTVFAFDLNFPFSGGAQVPTDPGANLLDTELLASQDARGTFGLFVVNNGASSIWTDAAEPDLETRQFANVPRGADPVRIGEVLVVADVPMLQAGDADQNLQFDQFDIITVSQAQKYFTGQPATWGEGDWNGAPGGGPGDPPPGDGLFDQFDLIAALSTGNYLAGPYAAVAAGEFGHAKHAILGNQNEMETMELLSARSLESVKHLANVDNNYVTVPEPQSVSLLIIGALTMLAYASRRSAR